MTICVYSHNSRNKEQDLNRDTILAHLRRLKPHYEKEGFVIEGLFGSYARNEANENSDIDILIHTEGSFAQRYGLMSISRLNKIQEEISTVLQVPVDLASSSGMGKTAQKFIIGKTIYI